MGPISQGSTLYQAGKACQEQAYWALAQALAYWARLQVAKKMKCHKNDFWVSIHKTYYAYSYDPFHGKDALTAECKM